MRFSLIPFRTTMVMPADTVWKKYQVFSPAAEVFLRNTSAKYGNYNKRMSGIHLAIPVFSKGYRPKQGKVAP